MNLEKYTERARGFVQAAQSLALREGHQQFTPEHLLKVKCSSTTRRAWPRA
jgi:ATP-dependent Clp protease ATP-binding subunit ClpB